MAILSSLTLIWLAQINLCSITSYKEVDLADLSEDAMQSTQLRPPNCPPESRCDFVMIDHYGAYLKQVINLNQSSGELSLLNPIDREHLVNSQLCDQNDCVLKFSIVDKLSNQMESIKMRILDVNDNRPIFNEQVYEIRISENIPIGYREPLPIAIDHDHGQNSRLTYYLFDYQTENTHTFSLSNLFGLVQDPPSLEVLGNLDYEQQQQYTFRLKAVDNGVPSLSSEILLSIVVTDVNDNMPQCFPESQSATIAENTKPGSFVGRIKAVDRDSPRFATLRYEIQLQLPPSSSTPKFRIDPLDGSIYLNDSLDYEEVRKYVLKVKVIEQSSGWFPIICGFEINVLDVNDNAPAIDISFTDYEVGSNGRKRISIRENTPVDQTVGTMFVSDSDGLDQNSQWELNFECEALKAIKIDDDSNKYILVSVELDREKRELYECRVEATDRSPPFFKTQIQFDVIVLDVNDNAPITHFPNRIDFKENTAVGSVVAVLNATDADFESNLSFSLAEPNSNFKLSSKGHLITLRPFDREMGDSCFEFSVNVTDNGNLTTQSTINVCVTDINDNRPKFAMKSYNFKVAENAEIGTIVGYVSADDKDSGDNGRFEFYFCSKRGQRPFSIEKNGTIRLVQKLDFELVSIYESDVCVRDFGEPRILTDRAHIKFSLINQNDNCPKFLCDRMVHYINRDIFKSDHRFDFLVEDQDGDTVEVLASLVPYWNQYMKVDLIKTLGTNHQFELSFGETIPRPGFYTIRLIARDIPQHINEVSCNTTTFVVFAIGTNSTNRSESIRIAEKSLQRYSFRSEGTITHLNQYQYLYIFGFLSILLLVVSSGIVFCSDRLKAIIKNASAKRASNDSSLFFITSQTINQSRDPYDSSTLGLPRPVNKSENRPAEQLCRDSGYESTEIRGALKPAPRAWLPLNYGFECQANYLDDDQIEISL